MTARLIELEDRVLQSQKAAPTPEKRFLLELIAILIEEENKE